MVGRRQAVSHWILIPAFPGSNPGAPTQPITVSVMQRTRRAHLVLLLGVLIVGAGLGAVFRSIFACGGWLSFAGPAFDFLNPLHQCRPLTPRPASSLFPYAPLEKTLGAYLKTQTQAKRILSASVYFRDMVDGHWFGINEKQIILPGSLLKVPLAMGYLKASESNPSLLEQETVFEDETLLKLYSIQGIAPKIRLELGRAYTVEDLIVRSLVYSDNVAAVLLERLDGHRAILNAAVDNDIPVRAGHPPNRALTNAEYAGFFRILFNSTYLNKANSNRVLQWLDQGTFRDGLVAGVPSNTRVAHKFGESTSDSAKEIHFHDCGIIYYPARPYLLCVMTRVSDTAHALDFIRAVSKQTYEVISSLYEK